MGSVYCRNTIWSSFGEPFFDKNTTGVYNFDHNLYHSTKAQPIWKWKGNNKRDFAIFQNDSEQETNGEFTKDPDLKDGIPSSAFPGTPVPGITGNKVLGSLTANKGAQIVANEPGQI